MLPTRVKNSAYLLNLLFPKIENCIVRYNSTDRGYEEIRIPVPWGHVAGKWWGPTNRRPILALHGWQDNCGSFNRLIPLLNKDIGVLAVDLPGHGYSSRLPSGLYYHWTQYLILIQYLSDYFKWAKISLLGHSLGAMNSFIYTMINPGKVDFLICIDYAKPINVENNMPRIAHYIEQFIKNEAHERSAGEPRSYTIEEMKQKTCLSFDNSVDYEHSHHLIERNVAPSKNSPGKYYFTRDPRLKGNELMNWPQEDVVEFAKIMTCPVFIGKAMDSSYYERKKYFYQVIDVLQKASVDLQYYRLEGKHHIHLNNPEVLADLMKQFIEKHDIEDRSVGGMKEGMRHRDAASNV